MVIRFGRKTGNYPEFSSFHNTIVAYDGLVFGNSEAAFQAMKTTDLDIRKSFTNLSGSKAKRLGRQVKLRPDWEEVKFDIMVDILIAKFSQNKALADLLISTGDAWIVENTTGWHDNVWGACNCNKCREEKISTNYLGLGLMITRAKLQGLDKCICSVDIKGEVFTIDLFDDTTRSFMKTSDGMVTFDKINRYAK